MIKMIPTAHIPDLHDHIKIRLLKIRIRDQLPRYKLKLKSNLL